MKKTLQFQVVDRITNEVVSNHKTAAAAERKAKGDRYLIVHHTWQCDGCRNWYDENEWFFSPDGDKTYFCETCAKNHPRQE